VERLSLTRSDSKYRLAARDLSAAGLSVEVRRGGYGTAEMADRRDDVAALAHRFRIACRYALHGGGVVLPDPAATPAEEFDALDALVADTHSGRRRFAWSAILSVGERSTCVHQGPRD
jgi:hypothetical protein